MDLHADPDMLRQSVHRLSALAGDLAAAADRLSRLTLDEGHSRYGGLARRCAGLGAGLRADAAELVECAELLRQDRAELLAGEASALAAVTGSDRRPREVRELPGWAR